MSRIVRPLSALALLAALGLAFAPNVAEARFGKASRGGGARGVPSGNVHPARPPGTVPGAPYGGPRGYGFAPYGPRVWYPYGGWWGYRPYFWGGPYIDSYAYPYATPYPPAYHPEDAFRPSPPMRVFLGAEGSAYVHQGGAFGLNIGFEKDRLGFDGQAIGIFVRPDDGSRGIDSIKLVNLHATFALLASEYGRLRLGFGLDSAFAPDVVMFGPGLALSGSVGVAGPLGLEGSIHVTPFPFTQLDTGAGVVVGLGRVGLRVGWRRIWLSDNGYVDGNIHTDIFSGPYIGVGFSL